MSVTAKCHNYTGCLLAYRGEPINVASGAPLVCPECGKAVSPVKGGAASLGKLIPWIVLIAVLAGGAFFALPYLKKNMGSGGGGGGTSPAPMTPAPGTPAPTTPMVSLRTPSPGTPASRPAATPIEPPLQPTLPAKIDIRVDREENKAMRKQVLDRIDLIPSLTPTNRDKLYNSVYRARSMGLVLTVPFGSGSRAMSGADIAAMKVALESGEVLKLRDDPTAVFVVLGYADAKGDEKKNLQISQERADSVVNAMRDKCGIGNVSHAVAMGGSTLHDAQVLEKNRIAEVWVVLP